MKKLIAVLVLFVTIAVTLPAQQDLAPQIQERALLGVPDFEHQDCELLVREGYLALWDNKCQVARWTMHRLDTRSTLERRIPGRGQRGP